MSKKVLRSGLFGYRKSDVLEYIERLDERAEKRLSEKEESLKLANEELKIKSAELEEVRKSREQIALVLEIAQKHANDILENAKVNADEIKREAQTEAEREKNNLNRELEIKKRDMENHFLNESKKINALRKEIEEMRRHSLESIKNFERDLYKIELSLEQKETYANKAVNSASDEGFLDFIKTVPIRIIKPGIKEEK